MSKGQRIGGSFSLDRPRRKDTESLYKWTDTLDNQLRELVLNISEDFRQGNAGMEVYDEEPTADELDTGQRVLYDTGSEVRIYTAIDDKLYYVTLTEVT